jgi:PAS domain S-box-containing protein
MVDTGRLTWPIQRRDDFVRIISYIVLATAFIFVFDILTPLGLVNWILYLIPLFLTVYLSWRYAPFVMTGVFVILMAVSLFLSPRDISLEYAVLNRTFFALILVIASVFIKEYISNVEGLASSEERYRTLIEWLPEGIVVYRPEGIAYINPAGTRLLGVDRGENPAGLDLFSMVDPGFQELFRQRIAQAEFGARLNLDKVRLIRQDGSGVTVDMVFGPAFWDKGTAVQILIRNA